MTASYSSAYDDLTDYLSAALLDAQYGHTRELIEIVAEYAFPDDPHLMAKHLNPRKLDYRIVDDLLADLASELISADDAMLMLADEMYDSL